MSENVGHRRYIGGADPLDRLRFPVHPWRLTETFFDPGDLGRTETLFAVGNGHLGMRGGLEEGAPSHEHGTFVNGFHETWPIQHAEAAFGLARVGQTMVTVPDATVLRVYVDDEPLLLSAADLVSYERTLDMAEGVLVRELVWQTPSGNRVRVRSRRMVSFPRRHLAVMTLEVTLLDWAAPVVISSEVINRYAIDESGRPRQGGVGQGGVGLGGVGLGGVRLGGVGLGGVGEPGGVGLGSPGLADPRRAEALNRRVLEPVLHRSVGGRATLAFQCATSRMTLAVAVDHTVTVEPAADDVAGYAVNTSVGAHLARTVVQMRGLPDQTITVTKVVSFHTSASSASGVPGVSTASAVELADRCARTLDRVRAEGVARQLADQRAWLDDYWARSDVEVPGQPAVQQAVRWNLFQVAQAAARAEGSGIAAKGLTGTGYSGHYFWDTEIYVVPYLVYTSPTMARNALRFRYAMLPAARRRAAELNESGALFPWRTINGEEASAYYAAGTAQYHINADIAYALGAYVDVTRDTAFLAREGIDILVQTARLWVGLGFWRGEGPGAFHIHGVTGPDEYTTVVNDNLYTNVMARMNLRNAAAAVRLIRQAWPAEHALLVARLDLRPEEIEEWELVADSMAIPDDEHLGINPQDSHFHEREIWDLDSTPPGRRPLLLYYHPLVIYRFQVLKQADVVLAMFLQGEDFSAERKRANFEYYEPITTGDSSLSAVVQAIVAAEVGYHALALDYFYDALYVDLVDRHRNTSDGVHVASAGGVWSMIVHGFAGMRRGPDGVVAFDPRLPEPWESVTFRIALLGTRLRVTVRPTEIAFVVETGDVATVRVRGVLHQVAAGEPVTVSLDGHGPRIPGKPDPRTFWEHARPDGSTVSATVP